MNKFIAYAVVVTFAVTVSNWVRMFSDSNASGRGSSWSSHTGSGGGSYGGGSGGGGHK